MKPIVIPVKEVLEIFQSLVQKCPICRDDMTVLGDLPIAPYHFCFKCKLKIPFKKVKNVEDLV